MLDKPHISRTDNASGRERQGSDGSGPAPSETKARIALVAFCILAIVGVFADHTLRPDPPVKGICTFCGAVQHAVNP